MLDFLLRTIKEGEKIYRHNLAVKLGEKFDISLHEAVKVISKYIEQGIFKVDEIGYVKRWALSCPTTKNVYEHIIKNGNAMMKDFALPRSVAEYHVKKLLKYDFIKRCKVGTSWIYSPVWKSFNNNN